MKSLVWQQNRHQKIFYRLRGFTLVQCGLTFWNLNKHHYFIVVRIQIRGDWSCWVRVATSTWNWNNVKTEIFRLKRHCKTHSLYYCTFVLCILIVSHIKEESDLKYCRNTLHWRLVAIRKRYLRFKRIKTLYIEKLFWTSAKWSWTSANRWR